MEIQLLKKHGLSLRQIAEEVSCAVNTVRRHLVFMLEYDCWFRHTVTDFRHRAGIAGTYTTPPGKTHCRLRGTTIARQVKEMAGIDDFVKKQKDGATFVISAQMLCMKPQEFNALVQAWFDEGCPGFNMVAMPHRTAVDGEFLISRVTVTKTVSSRT